MLDTPVPTGSTLSSSDPGRPAALTVAEELDVVVGRPPEAAPAPVSEAFSQ